MREVLKSKKPEREKDHNMPFTFFVVLLVRLISSNLISLPVPRGSNLSATFPRTSGQKLLRQNNIIRC